MAKYEARCRSDFDSFVDEVDSSILNQSGTVELVDSTELNAGGTRVEVRVYERFSAFSGSRVALTLTIMGYQDDLQVSAIAAGGSQALLFKINTLSEESFLDTAVIAIDEAISRR